MLNQQDMIVIQDNVINRNGVMIMLALILITVIIQYFVCTYLNRQRVSVLKQYKVEVAQEKREFEKQKRKETYE